MNEYMRKLIARVKVLQEEVSFILYVLDECIHHEKERDSDET